MSWLDDIRTAKAALERKGALADLYPELSTREHLFSSAAWAGGDGLNALDDYVGHARLFQSYTWVAKAIRIIVQNIAPLPVRVVNAKGEAQLAHPLSLLLAAPNDRQDAAALWEGHFAHKLIGGEGFLEVVDDAVGRPRELWVRRPDRVRIERDETRLNYPSPASYVYTGDDPTPVPIPPSHMLHDLFHNPLNVWRGISPVAAVRTGVTIDILAQAWSKGFLQRGARPDYAIVAKQALTPKERTRLEEEAAEKYGGVGNAHKVMILDDDAKVETFSFAPKDLEWLEQRRFSRDEVGAIFGVPDEIMGYGKDTYENFEAAFKLLWLLTNLPLIQRRDAVLTLHFTRMRPLLRPGERIATDLSGVGVLQEDDAPRIEKAGKLWALGVPFNTLDERLKLGIGPIPGGDVGFVPASLLPATEAAAPLPDSPPPGNTDSAQPAQRAMLTSIPKAARVTRQATRTGRALQRIRRRVAAKMAKAVDAYFDDLAETVIGRISKAWAAPVRKELPSIDVLFALEDREDLRLIVRRFYAEIIEASWETWNTALGTEIAFDLDDPALVELLDSSAEQVRLIDAATRRAVQKLLAYGGEQGWGIDQLVRGDDERPGLRALIQETYKNRARAISRTETGRCQNLAGVQRYADAGVDKVLVLDDGSENSDERCKELNGTVQTLDWARQNPLQHTNCVRAFSPYFSGD